MLSLTQLIQPLPQPYWRSQLLTSLQGVGGIAQTAPLTNYVQGTGTITPSGPATVAASVVVVITTSGEPGTGAFEYSLDNGVTLSGAITMPAGSSNTSGSYLIQQIGVTLTFTTGSYVSPGQTYTFVAGEQYAFPTYVPTFPVTNWEAIAPSNGLITADSTALTDMDLTQAQIAAGGLTQSWITPPPWGPPPDGYCDLLSQNFYNRPRIQGAKTTGLVTLLNAGTASRIITVGEMVFATATGQQFTNSTAGTVAGGGGTLVLTAQASAVGASFNNVPTLPISPIPGGNYITTIVTPTLAGVSVSNPINSAPSCLHTGTGPGSITFTGTANQAANVIFLITLNGTLGTSTYSYSLDGGNTYLSAGVTTATGVTLFGAMQVSFPTGTYVAGDTYEFSTGWIVSFGADPQSSASLATADQNQWSQLAPSSPAGTYQNWALAATAEVTSSFVTQSVTVPGQVNLLLIGQNNGPVSISGIAAVQAYVQARLGINDSVLTSTITPVPVVVTASSSGIQIHSSQAASVYAGVTAALYKLQISTPPGGTAPNHVLAYDAVLAAIEDVPGVIEVAPGTLKLNGGTSDIPLQPSWVPAIVPPPQTSYTLA